MKSLLIFGASRGTGFELVKLARQQASKIIAVVRHQPSAEQLAALGVNVIIGDANDTATVAKACETAGEHTTIVSTLGGQNANYQAQINIINQAEQHNIKRMILVSSLGCGDSWPTLSDRAKAAFGFSVREKTLGEVWLQTSQLDYCILRPGGLVDQQATGNAQCYQNQEVHGFITRSDLASTILDKSRQASLDHSVYSIIDPQLVVQRNYKES